MVIYTPPAPVPEPQQGLFDVFLAHSQQCFPSDFSRAVLQAAQTDRIFRSAIISLAAAQQLYEYANNSVAEKLQRVAMQEYGKALQLLRSCSSKEDSFSETALICPVLFASFESLLGCRNSAVIHIQSWPNLLRQGQSPTAWSLVSRETMTSIFIRLENQLVELLGTAIAQPVNADCAHAGTMISPVVMECATDDLGYSLDNLLNHVFRHQLNFSFLNEGHVLGGPLMSQEQIRSEDAWDEFRHEFDSIVNLSESYLARTVKGSRARTFSFSLGVIPPLYTTATRCLDPRIRRRAIHLLDTYKRREGMWDSVHAAGVARRVMEIEEAEAGVPGTRVKLVTAVLDDEDGAKIHFQ
ncbi:hypothetical protein BJX70DRAFT_391990 [Aspergillus crustosus]